jgi:hypothetical protein
MLPTVSRTSENTKADAVQTRSNGGSSEKFKDSVLAKKSSSLRAPDDDNVQNNPAIDDCPVDVQLITSANSASAHESGSDQHIYEFAVKKSSSSDELSKNAALKVACAASDVVQASLQNTYHRAFKRLNFFGHLATGARQLIQTHVQATCNFKLPVMEYSDVVRSIQGSSGTLQGAIRKAPRAQRRKVMLISTDQSVPSVASVAITQGLGEGRTPDIVVPATESAPAPVSST